MKEDAVLVINPGSTSTKLALFTRGEPVYVEKIDHTGTPISGIYTIIEQLPLRYEIVVKICEPWLKEYKLLAVVGRGGLVGPVESGIYRIDNQMINILKTCKYGAHASNLGALLAYEISKKYDLPSFIVDPVTVDEYIPEAHISGVPEITRDSILHALNVRACARKEAQKLGKNLDEVNFIIAHLGGGISIVAFEKGRIVDSNGALLGMGPFSPERAGALPIKGLLELAMSGKYTSKDLQIKFTKFSGLKGYLGTNDVREVIKRIENGDEEAALIFRAMIYQICKEIGAMATVLKGEFDRIIITGGVAQSKRVIDSICERVKFLGKISIYSGDWELEAMAKSVFRAIDGLEKIKSYKG